ncbi:GNAT family N-acetyltransferase [Phycicoccus flavus]|uniref:GNAT family N-acetyltransferase n=1 Tax=Phycicoccus flavus TaxID=2502783 RepID=A0A8T6R3T0_9MICO|nr:GNAT family N-acetyltransferase [Phycicoccus flavus]NHA68334.1 GNAT family N-acetyltransferase [Phycicoccus flavus]
MRRPDPSARPAPAEIRPATPEDADRLTTVERAASLAALGHVFPPDEYPYPTDDVRARWVRTLADAAVTVLVLDDELRPGALVAFVAVDDTGCVRHLGVRPRSWGHGHARRMLEAANTRTDRPRLWVLEGNTRARGLYEHLGWRATGRSRAAEWPPYPTEVELTRTAGRDVRGPAG